jgi:hypothetical protein
MKDPGEIDDFGSEVINNRHLPTLVHAIKSLVLKGSNSSAYS